MKLNNYSLLPLLCSTLFMLITTNLITFKGYDVLGNEVATLVNEEKPAGEYEVEFSIEQNSILSFSSGIYFYQLRTADPSTSSGQSFVETKKMLLLK